MALYSGWDNVVALGADVVIVATVSGSQALEAATGALRWTFPGSTMYPPAVVLGDGTALFTTEQGIASRVGLADGGTVWQGVLSYQGAVRAMISDTITRPKLAAARPGIRFGLIDYALAPFESAILASDPAALDQLKRDLAVVVSAEALFTLTDLCRLSPDQAVASAARTAATVTAAAFRDDPGPA